MRMFDVWSTLAQKYSRRIDEDDIVDLVTGEIVKDRGVLSAETSWKFGRFADDSVDDSTGTDEDEDDDVDELDAFAGSPQVSPRAVPPVRTVDPADAKDLEEFLDAERRRREDCGEEEDESEDDGDLGHPEVAFDAAEPAPSRPVELDDDSDDELGNWGIVDESNIVCLVDNKLDTTEIIEILDSPLVSPTRSTTPRPETPPPQSKRTPDRKPPSRAQLHTPPQSRTPSILSSVDGFVPVATPPLSSPSKPRPADSQVRPRSRSQATSPRPHKDNIHVPLPRLNLAEVVIERGRSVHKRMVRSPSESLGEPKPSTSSAVDRRPAISRRSTPKSKAESNPQSHAPFNGEEKAFLRSPESSPRKRKRKSLSLDNKDDGSVYGKLYFLSSKVKLSVNNLDVPSSSSSFRSTPTKNRMRSASVSAKSKSNRPAVKSEEASDSDPDPETEPEAFPPHHRPRQMSAVPSFYPPPAFYPYPPYPPDVHPPIPLQDHAQFIISQAMHQLSTLFTAPWPTQPFTPPRHPSSTASASQFTPYSYPATPRHPHTHPYVFDSGASVGTLPPSSPPGSPPPSSSPLRSNGPSRRASLVPRSRSRGRRVSFKLDGDDLRHDTVDSEDLPVFSPHDSRDAPVGQKDKGKGKMATDDRTSSPTRKTRKNQKFTI